MKRIILTTHFLKSLMFCSAALILLLFSPLAPAQIMGTLSNFDAHNDSDDSMTNLELDLRNINPVDILKFYQGANAWGIPAIKRDIGGSEVTWADFRNPIQQGQMYHFGLRIDPNAPHPCGVQAYWTRHVKVIEIPVPWQTWRAEPNTIVDVIRLDANFAEAVMIKREYAVGPFRVPLDDLNWDVPLPVSWTPVPTDPVVLNPGDKVELSIPVVPGDQGVFVRYTVALQRNPDNVITRFVNEAEIEMGLDRQIPSIVGTLSNFDAHNDTGKPVHDLELDILNIAPQDVWEWYKGANSWGLHPATNDPYIAPIPGGTEVNWVDEWTPMKYCETKHFGLRLNPNTPEPFVRAYWTRIVKVWQLPVPWQWWQIQPGNFVRDIIQLSDTFDASVVILREWATSSTTVPLDQLVWDNPSIIWNPDPGGPVTLEPGVPSFFDVFVDLNVRAVLIRYTVTRIGATEPETRFVNEAEIDWIPVEPPEPQIIGNLSNFDATNVSGGKVSNLELEMRLIKPEHILDWYKGSMAWGLHPTSNKPIIQGLPQSEVTWADFRKPIGSCETRHFGVELASDAAVPCGVQGYWTKHLKVVEIPVPWQTWRVDDSTDNTIIDRISLSADFGEAVQITREYARGPFRVPLDELNWDNPTIPWLPVSGDPVVIPPGGAVELPIKVEPGDQGVFVRYTVALESNPDDLITRFVNEAEIVMPGPPMTQQPSIVGTLSNFDAHNETGKPVHDLELDILNIQPADVLDWYRGMNAWGIDPVIASISGGTEVTWIDDHNPMTHCETKHFGLRLNPNTPEPLVRAFWTREIKVKQIPVPWQFWLVPPGSFVRDVVQLSDTFSEAVTIRRDYAVQDTLVPLDDLNWDLIAKWIPDPAGPITLDPGFQADLDVAVDEDDAAVLIRYEVSLTSSGAIITRFTNEAMLGPGIVTGLKFKPNKQDFYWNPSPLAGTVFDIIKGDLMTMRNEKGIYSGWCFQNDLSNPEYTDSAIPPSGQGFYYVVRSQNGTSYGTYDTTTDPVRREGRDAEIASGGGDCP
ncbi:MAG: hypothetical protein AB1756_10355 [Acidobacteriota bacterium]